MAIGAYCSDGHGHPDPMCPACVDAQRATERSFGERQGAIKDDYRRSRDLAVAAAERSRIAHKMRVEYPLNRHALEWADWIEREST